MLQDLFRKAPRPQDGSRDNFCSVIEIVYICKVGRAPVQGYARPAHCLEPKEGQSDNHFDPLFFVNAEFDGQHRRSLSGSLTLKPMGRTDGSFTVGLI